MVHLGDGRLHVVADLVLERAHDRALFLQRAGGWQVQLDAHDPDEHGFDGGSMKVRMGRAGEPAGPQLRVRANSSMVYASIRSPTLTSFMPSSAMPHSNPLCTSLTSS